MARTVTTLGAPAVPPAVILRGRAGGIRWIGTGSTTAPEKMDVAGAGAGGVPVATVTGVTCGGKEGAAAGAGAGAGAGVVVV